MKTFTLTGGQRALVRDWLISAAKATTHAEALAILEALKKVRFRAEEVAKDTANRPKLSADGRAFEVPMAGEAYQAWFDSALSRKVRLEDEDFKVVYAQLDARFAENAAKIKDPKSPGLGWPSDAKFLHLAWLLKRVADGKYEKGDEIANEDEDEAVGEKDGDMVLNRKSVNEVVRAGTRAMEAAREAIDRIGEIKDAKVATTDNGR